MMDRKGRVLVSCGAGLYAAAALGYINHAFHEGNLAYLAMYVAFGLYAAGGAMRLAGTRREPTAVAGVAGSSVVILAAVLPLAARPGGEVIWEHGVWVATLGALLGFLAVIALGDSFGIAPANRGVVSRGPYGAVRHPMAMAFIIVACGFLLIQFSIWNAVLLGVSAVLAIVAAMMEENLLRGDAGYREYASRVRYRFVPGVV